MNTRDIEEINQCWLQNKVMEESVVLNWADQKNSLPFLKNTGGSGWLRHHEAILNFKMYGGEVYANIHI